MFYKIEIYDNVYSMFLSLFFRTLIRKFSFTDLGIHFAGFVTLFMSGIVKNNFSSAVPCIGFDSFNKGGIVSIIYLNGGLQWAFSCLQ